MQLPMDGKSTSVKDLPAASLQALQSAFSDVHYVIIDEKSMVHLTQLSWIDQRCRQIFPTRNDESFGGLSIVLLGEQQNLAEWNSLSLKDIMLNNQEKPTSECLRLLLNKLSSLQHGLMPTLRGIDFLHNKVVTACQGVPACRYGVSNVPVSCASPGSSSLRRIH